jgi:hypothetical protein
LPPQSGEEMKMVDAMRAHIKNTPSLLMQLVAASGGSLGEPLTCATWGGGNNKSEVCQFTVYNKYGSHSACPDKPGERAYDDSRVFILRLERDENRQPLEFSVGLHLAKMCSVGPAAEFGQTCRTLTGGALAGTMGAAAPPGAARATTRAAAPAAAPLAVPAAAPPCEPASPLLKRRKLVETVRTLAPSYTDAELKVVLLGASIAFEARLLGPTSTELFLASHELGDLIEAYHRKFTHELFIDLTADNAVVDGAPLSADPVGASLPVDQFLRSQLVRKCRPRQSLRSQSLWLLFSLRTSARSRGRVLRNLYSFQFTVCSLLWGPCDGRAPTLLGTRLTPGVRSGPDGPPGRWPWV